MSVFNKSSSPIFDKIYWAIPYKVKDFYYSIRDFFNPRQKWLTKKIGNGWCDKVELIKIVAFESILHFVEEEEAFERIEWSATEQHAEAAKAFKRAYDIVKLKLPILQKRREKLWKDPDLCHYFHKDFLEKDEIQVEHEEPILQGSVRYKVKDPSLVQRDALDALRENEKEIESLEQEAVEIVAKYRNYMWT